MEQKLQKEKKKGSDQFKKKAKKKKKKIANQNYNLEHEPSVPHEDIKIDNITIQKLEYNKGTLRLAKVYIFHRPYVCLIDTGVESS